MQPPPPRFDQALLASGHTAAQPGWFGKLLAALLSLGLLALAVVFSLAALLVVAVGGLALWGWLRWKTRSLRQRPAAPERTGPQVIEGEFERHPDQESPQ